LELYKNAEAVEENASFGLTAFFIRDGGRKLI